MESRLLDRRSCDHGVITDRPKEFEFVKESAEQ
jgi:hypothetical protein